MQNIDPANDPVLALIERYKAHIKESHLKDEIYKWELVKRFQGRPNVNAPDFEKELLEIDFKNLIYPVGIAVTKHIAKDRTEAFRIAFKKLLDDSASLEDRLRTFSQETLKIYRELVANPKLSHHQDERTMATYLAYFDSTKYAFYKDSFYRKYCQLQGLKPKKKGEKYIHYLQLLDEFIEKYIRTDEELLQLKASFIPADAFEDKNHKLFAQDILYQSLDRQAGHTKRYWRIGTSDNNGR